MSITFFMGAGPAVKPVRHFLSPDRMEGGIRDGLCLVHVGAGICGRRRSLPGTGF